MSLKAAWKQFVREVGLGDPKATSVPIINRDIEAMNVKLRCMMTLGGYKVKPPGLTDEQIKQFSDEAATETANFILMLRCAEDVILRHGHRDEYLAQVGQANGGLRQLLEAKMSGLYDAVMRKIRQEGSKEAAKRDGLEGMIEEAARRSVADNTHANEEGERADPMGMTLGDAEEAPGGKVN